MRNEKKSYLSRLIGVVLSGFLSLVSFGNQTAGSKDIINKVTSNFGMLDVVQPIESKNITHNQAINNVVEVENQKKSEQIYRTKTGECYHKGECKCLNDSKIEISEQEVKESDLRPCSKCHKNKISDSKVCDNQKKSEKFYRTKTGKCYHKGTCGCLRNSKMKVSENEIKQADLTPCKKCCK